MVEYGSYRPTMLVGCFQVDILKDDSVIKHMEDTTSNKEPTTTDGRYDVDLCFANFQVDVLIKPLKIPLHKHKAVFFKTKRKPEIFDWN
ncbi:hypothetical protein MTO96_044606, partial [Rhipicephalus appendiculatus]